MRGLAHATSRRVSIDPLEQQLTVIRNNRGSFKNRELTYSTEREASAAAHAELARRSACGGNAYR
jgi:hypothetical protein